MSALRKKGQSDVTIFKSGRFCDNFPQKVICCGFSDKFLLVSYQIPQKRMPSIAEKRIISIGLGERWKKRQARWVRVRMAKMISDLKSRE